MSNSKKLAIAQLSIVGLYYILQTIVTYQLLGIYVNKSIINFKIFNNFSHIHELNSYGVAAFITSYVCLALLIAIGIIQIVTKVKETTSGIYLAAGICAVLAFLPLMTLAIAILNIIACSMTDQNRLSSSTNLNSKSKN